MLAEVYNSVNEKIDRLELPSRIFGRRWNPDLVHQALQVQLANEREPLAHTKGRGEVRGGGRKPWKQKHTGRARHGSVRSPIWKGGGVTHGPTKEKKYSLKINQKMRQAAIFSVLSKKLKDDEIRIIDALSLDKPKTKLVLGILKNFFDSRKSVLVIPEEGNKSVYRATANLPRVKSIDPRSLNVYDLLRHKYIFLEKNAVSTINNHYHAVR
jgi:large subunit ribosomal protein L4